MGIEGGYRRRYRTYRSGKLVENRLKINGSSKESDLGIRRLKRKLCNYVKKVCLPQELIND